MRSPAVAGTDTSTLRRRHERSDHVDPGVLDVVGVNDRRALGRVHSFGHERELGEFGSPGGIRDNTYETADCISVDLAVVQLNA
jgi:hypothetical protein